MVFAVIGRHLRADSMTAPDIVRTAMPFLMGVVTAWLFLAPYRNKVPVLARGLAVAAGAIIVGLLVRMAFGEDTPRSFVWVATVALTVLLLGWRLIAWGIVVMARRIRENATEGPPA